MFMPNTKWTWAFCLVELSEAIIVLALEAYVFGSFQTHLIDGHDTHRTKNPDSPLANGDPTTTIPTFLALYIFAFLYQLVLVWDALRMKNTIQVIGLVLLNVGLLIYGAVQTDQLAEAVHELTEDGAIKNSAWKSVKPVLIAIPCIIAFFTVVTAFLAYKLYDEFAWTIYKHISADLKMKKRFLIYQIYIALLKFDFFFFLGFTIQFATSRPQGSDSSLPSASHPFTSEPQPTTARPSSDTQHSTGAPSSKPATSQANTSKPATSQANTSEAPIRSSTIAPTATNSQTSMPAVNSIITATSERPTSKHYTATTIPSALPSSIVPKGGVPEAPDDSTLIQLGFTYGLNYPFVVSNSWAAQQIFDWLPAGISYGIGADEKDVVMQYLQPYNTLADLGYITTLAMAYIPNDQVNPLSLALLNPGSDLYHHPNPTVKTLMSMIDPSIPLLAGSSLGDGSAINAHNGATDDSDSDNADGSAAGDDSDSNVSPSSIGIGVGVVCGAAVYGAAMFMVARRYKKRKNGHKRASSVNPSGQPLPAEQSNLMYGGRGSYGSQQSHYDGRNSRTSDHSQHSGRTFISPPVMAENSLGWN